MAAVLFFIVSQELKVQNFRPNAKHNEQTFNQR